MRIILAILLSTFVAMVVTACGSAKARRKSWQR